jgi:uncharacterized membrane protein YczE
MNVAYKLFVKTLYLFLGFFIVSVGLVAIVESRLGVNSWNVLHTGISQIAGITLGRATQIVAFTVIILGWIMGIRPSFATFANMYFVGLFIDLIMQNNIVPPSNSYFMQWAYLLAGTAVFGVGCGIYINAGFGTGPRDSLLMGIVRKTSWSIKGVKTGLEITVLIAGIILGGQFGIGTIVHTLTVGIVLQWAINFFKLPKSIRMEKDMNTAAE